MRPRNTSNGRKHVKQYLDNVSFCERAEEESEIRLRKAQAAASLEPLMRKAVSLPLVQDTWLPQYDRPLFRRTFLVLSGPSQLGKTLYAHSLCPAGTCFELNCAGSTDLDLRAFSPLRHSLILFDEASPQLVLQHKKLFQGGLEEITMGQSQTSCLFLQSVGAWHKDGTDVQQMDRRLGCLVC